MGHSMLGPHINWKEAQIPWLRQTKPRVAKVLLQNVDKLWMQEARAASPETFWVGRLVSYPQPLDSPHDNARRFTNELLLPAAEAFRGLVDALEGYNEVAFSPMMSRGVARLAAYVDKPMRPSDLQTARSEMQRYALFERTRTEILHREGWKSVLGNFSAGTPELELWPDFYPALEVGDYLGLHEYSANNQPPYMANLDTWLCRRYQRVYEALPEALRLPLIITECGIDGGMVGHVQHGWKSYTDLHGYMRELEWYDDSLQADAARWPIIGATVYCYGHVDPRWSTFDIAGPMAERLSVYMQANPPLPWQETPEEPPQEEPDPLVELLQAELGANFDDIRAELTQTGEYDKRPNEGINYQVIHHTGTGTTSQTYSNTIARYHVEQNGWPAIGYHFLIYAHKVRYVGSLDTSRANVRGRNPEVIGIALVGDYTENWPAASVLSLCKRLCDALDGYLGRRIPRVGHRDVALPGHGTACPGDSAYGPDGWLQEIQPDEVTPPPPDEEEIAQLKARITQLEAQLAAAQQENAQLAAQLEAAQQENVQLAAQLQALQQEKARLDDMIAQIRQIVA